MWHLVNVFPAATPVCSTTSGQSLAKNNRTNTVLSTCNRKGSGPIKPSSSSSSSSSSTQTNTQMGSIIPAHCVLMRVQAPSRSIHFQGVELDNPWDLSGGGGAVRLVFSTPQRSLISWFPRTFLGFLTNFLSPSHRLDFHVVGERWGAVRVTQRALCRWFVMNWEALRWNSGGIPGPSEPPAVLREFFFFCSHFTLRGLVSQNLNSPWKQNNRGSKCRVVKCFLCAINHKKEKDAS